MSFVPAILSNPVLNVCQTAVQGAAAVGTIAGLGFGYASYRRVTEVHARMRNLEEAYTAFFADHKYEQKKNGTRRLCKVGVEGLMFSSKNSPTEVTLRQLGRRLDQYQKPGQEALASYRKQVQELIQVVQGYEEEARSKLVVLLRELNAAISPKEKESKDPQPAKVIPQLLATAEKGPMTVSAIQGLLQDLSSIMGWMDQYDFPVDRGLSHNNATSTVSAIEASLSCKKMWLHSSSKDHVAKGIAKLLEAGPDSFGDDTLETGRLNEGESLLDSIEAQMRREGIKLKELVDRLKIWNGYGSGQRLFKVLTRECPYQRSAQLLAASLALLGFGTAFSYFAKCSVPAAA
jgi:hypothetical protein